MFCLYKTELPTSTKIDYEKIGNRGKGIRQEKCQLGLILCQSDKLTQWKTRMHSSRMRTDRSLPYGGYLSRGCLCPGVSLSSVGSLYPGGVFVQEGEFLSRGLCPGVSVQGVSVQGGLCPGTSVSGGSLSGRPPPPVDRQTPMKILPCPKLRLGAVIINVVD